MSDLEDLLASADPAARRDDDPSSHHAKGQIYLRVVASRGEDMTRRHGHGVRWSRRLAVASFCLVVVVAVTAVTVAVTRPATTTALSEPSMHIAPLTDVSATPPGWVAVPFYSVQVSVPSAWHIQAPGESSCSSGGPGEGLLFLGEETGSGSL
ncbi:MAG TPA: hypothetical protein VGS21_11635, partial [Acidimicrobiales bacterium]|nr:hypothetical protein [Acidimicrobiales bacterium]